MNDILAWIQQPEVLAVIAAILGALGLKPDLLQKILGFFKTSPAPTPTPILDGSHSVVDRANALIQRQLQLDADKADLEKELADASAKLSQKQEQSK